MKKLLTNKFVSPKSSNYPLIFEFPAKYQQKIKIFIGHSKDKINRSRKIKPLYLSSRTNSLEAPPPIPELGLEVVVLLPLPPLPKRSFIKLLLLALGVTLAFGGFESPRPAKRSSSSSLSNF